MSASSDSISKASFFILFFLSPNANKKQSPKMNMLSMTVSSQIVPVEFIAALEAVKKESRLNVTAIPNAKNINDKKLGIMMKRFKSLPDHAKRSP
ncbi:TPA: hypothetical protein NID02_001626 [Pseudomonas aeruginosa]|nr:hypothetical protein [Pseudomonas aeruginosa]